MDEYNKDYMPDESTDHMEDMSTENPENKEIGPDENIEYDYAQSEAQTQSEAQPEEENVDQDQTQADEQNNKFAYHDNHYEQENKNPQYHPEQNQTMEQTPMDLKDWILTLVILMIPCVGIVMYFVWAFGNTGNINRRNFCRAQLIIFGVLLVIYLLFFVLFGAVMTRAFIYY